MQAAVSAVKEDQVTIIHASQSYKTPKAKAGYGKTRKEVRLLAGMAAHDKGRINNSQVSHGWFKRVSVTKSIIRIAEVIPQPAENVRINCLNKDSMTR